MGVSINLDVNSILMCQVFRFASKPVKDSKEETKS